MQQVAVEKYTDWYLHPTRRNRPWFEISGPAGSGKTTLVKYIMQELGIEQEYVNFMALVGKATLALKLSGVNAKTIHSTIYDLVNTYARDDDGNIINVNGKPKLKSEFVKKLQLEGNPQQLVIDEGGMVGSVIGEDLLSFNIPSLFLGDLKQLPPVMSKRMFLSHPDVELNEIMRQDKDSPIIYLSQLASHGIAIPYGKYGNNECRVIRHDQLKDEDLVEADIIICGTNSMRDTINSYVRKNIYNIHEPYIVPGDKLICRQNKWDLRLNEDISLVNGLIGYVEKVYRETRSSALMEIDFRPEFFKKEQFKRLPINHKYPFLPYSDRLKTNSRFAGDKTLLEFGHCITCHLAQGSQYKNVIVYVENVSTSLYFRQWLYTAITRAQEKLTLVI